MGKVYPAIFAVILALLISTAWLLPHRKEDRTRLLEIAATDGEAPETRLEAIRRLLVLQDKKACRATLRKGTGIDHPMVFRRDDGSFVATLSEEPDLPGRHPWFWQPKCKSDYEDYWSMDRLEFDRTGRLLYWGPHR